MPKKRNPNYKNTWELVGGQVIYQVHDPSRCAGNVCPIHSPTRHHMSEWPQNFRSDSMLMERICEHGIGHPDPDDPRLYDEGVHGCDGCCRPPTEVDYEQAKLEVLAMLDDLGEDSDA